MFFTIRRNACAVAAASGISFIALADAVRAQDAPVESPLPDVVVTQPADEVPKAVAKMKAAKKVQSATQSAVSQQVQPAESYEPADVQGPSPADATGLAVVPGTRSASLTVPTVAEAKADIETTPGGVDLVSAEEYKSSTPSVTLKDALDYVPGVFVQPKWGEDTRISIRGSSLSRNFHLRGIQLYMDGIPINTADGFGDFQEIDPTAYRFIEVYKGANALRFGANSLGGAINFVMPTGYDSDLFGARVDVGSFGFHKVSASSGGVYGAADYFITGTWQEQDGFREHSDGESVRGSMSLGYRLSRDLETRFYINANSVDQRIPGGVTKSVALSDPKEAAAIDVANDWQRNIDTVRIANKTTWRVQPGTYVEFGTFYVDRHLMHPIFQWLDYEYDDYGGFARVFDDRNIGGFRNRFVAGVNIHNGEVDARQFGNGPSAAKGNPTSRSIDTSRNTAVYAENSFYVTSQLALVAGTQFLHAERERDGILNLNDGSGEFDLWSPKAGLIYELTPTAQIFANISRSAEVPSFGENTPIFGSPFAAKAQRGTTYELGTRGGDEDFAWDVSLYRANLDNELMCVAPFPVATFCVVANANETIHQGVEAGFSGTLRKGLFETGSRPDRLWFNAAYTFSDFRFDNDPLFGNNELPGAPRHYLRAELLYKHPSGVYFGPNVEWVPEAYYVDSANTLDTKPYALLGAKVGFDNGGAWSAYVEARNLTDEIYIASTSITNVADPATTNFFEPGTGRAVYGGVSYRW